MSGVRLHGWMVPCAFGVSLVIGGAMPRSALAQERLTLAAAVAEARERNLDVLAARIGLSVAEAASITAGLRPNPVLSLGGDHLDLLGTGFDNINTAGPPEYSVRVDLVLERGAKRARRIEVAAGERAVARADLLETLRTLTFGVQQAYVDLQLAEESLGIARDNAASLDALVTLIEARVRAGDVAEVELLRSRIAALQARQAARAAELRARAARRQLEQVMGRLPGAAPMVLDPIVPPPIATLDAGVLQAEALAARPDLAAVRAAQARAQSDLRLQQAVGRIDFVLGAEYRRQEGLAGRGNSLGFFLSTPLPVFDRNQGEVARARESIRLADTTTRRLEQAIAAEVDLALADFTIARDLLAMVETGMVAEARDTRDITEYAYRRGEASLIEVLDAQRAFNEAMQAWSDARAAFARAAFGLQAAIGWEVTP